MRRALCACSSKTLEDVERVRETLQDARHTQKKLRETELTSRSTSKKKRERFYRCKDFDSMSVSSGLCPKKSMWWSTV